MSEFHLNIWTITENAKFSMAGEEKDSYATLQTLMRNVDPISYIVCNR